MSKNKFSFYKEHPKTCEPDDYWGQVKRTVNGVAVSQDQIDLIVDAIVSGLGLDCSDVLLDLCCGNGALSTLVFSHCAGGLGVDFSEHLISIANKSFANSQAHEYVLKDVIEFCEAPVLPGRFTKALCYGAFSYLEHAQALRLLRLLHAKFDNLTQVFIGNCPDKEYMEEFFSPRVYEPGIENEPDSPIGIWRTQEEFIAMANDCGWNVSISKMPSTYYAAHYRYDVVLNRI